MEEELQSVAYVGDKAALNGSKWPPTVAGEQGTARAEVN
jgi:hypothetical protein